ncbi:MAG: lipid-A-disaccharide synthase [Bacteroidales bacterium]
MNYFLIAGEASGDLHGSNLIHGLKLADPEAKFRGWGGDLMAAEGMTLNRHYRTTAFMGIWEVLKNLRTVFRNLKQCQQEILDWQPDVVIFIDYPGFNLRMARFAKEAGFRTYYYISPKIWAWKASRVEIIKKYVDEMFIIFPFEKAFYARYNYHKVHFEGNPLIDAINEKRISLPSRADFLKENRLTDKPIVALLCGSRKQEISLILPEMLEAAKAFPDRQFVIAGAPSIDESFYRQFLQESGVQVVMQQTYALLQHAEAAVVTSGTATLETALFEVPQVVCYKTSPISYHVGIHFLKIPYFSLVNIIMGREVVKEILQFRLASEIRQEIQKILTDTAYREEMLTNYRKLKEISGGTGASQRVAGKMVNCLQNQPTT